MAKKKVRTPVDFSELGGYRYLHFGSEWIQGGMQINRPYRLALEYQQSMMALALFEPHPKEILQLGLGAAGFAKFTWKYLPEAKTTVVEISEDVYMACRMWFKLPEEDDHLKIVFEDCKKYLFEGNFEPVDWLLVDIYDAEAWGPVYDDVPFYRLCRKALREGGVASFNLFGGEDFEKSYKAISEAFYGQVLIMPEVQEGNRIVIASKGEKKDYSIEQLKERAAEIQARLKVPAKKWVKMLQKENSLSNEFKF